MSDGITDGNRPPALCDVLEYELASYKAHGIAPTLTANQAEEALENCRALSSLRSRMHYVRQAVEATDISEEKRLEWLRRIVSTRCPLLSRS